MMTLDLTQESEVIVFKAYKVKTSLTKSVTNTHSLTHHKNSLFPTWLDSSYPQRPQSLQFSSAHLSCFIPERYSLCCIMGNTDHANNIPWLHICTKKLQRGLTVFQSWPLEWSCLSSRWSWFRCSGPSQTGPAVWQFQTISPWTVRAKIHRSYEWRNHLFSNLYGKKNMYCNYLYV